MERKDLVVKKEDYFVSDFSASVSSSSDNCRTFPVPSERERKCKQLI
jgi:hypothetical protein